MEEVSAKKRTKRGKRKGTGARARTRARAPTSHTVFDACAGRFVPGREAGGYHHALFREPLYVVLQLDRHSKSADEAAR